MRFDSYTQPSLSFKSSIWCCLRWSIGCYHPHETEFEIQELFMQLINTKKTRMSNCKKKNLFKSLMQSVGMLFWYCSHSKKYIQKLQAAKSVKLFINHWNQLRKFVSRVSIGQICQNPFRSLKNVYIYMYIMFLCVNV